MFRQGDPQPTGSGVIRSFVRIQGAAAHSPTQQGYNTDARPVQFDEEKNTRTTRSIQLSAIPTVSLGGTLYREFLLDVSLARSQTLVSLDDVKIFVSARRNLTGYDAATGRLSGLAPVYDLDAGGDNYVLINKQLNRGNSFGDMVLFVPDSFFGGGDPYVYLYSRFGMQSSAQGGSEQWAPGPPQAAPPVTTSVSGTAAELSTGLGVSGQTVYIDANGNGVLDAGEVSAVTDAAGNYTLANLGTAAGATLTVRIQTTAPWVAFNDTQLVAINPGDNLTGVNWDLYQDSGTPTG
jgi:hypothetical protein